MDVDALDEEGLACGITLATVIFVAQNVLRVMRIRPVCSGTVVVVDSLL